VTPTATPTATPIVVTARVEGQVLDEATQTGIPDLLMTLTGSEELTGASELARGNQVYTTTTDLNGVYVFPAVELGDYTLTGAKAGTVIVSPAPLTVSGDQPIQVPPLVVSRAQSKIYLPLVTK
jgi:hypothetical protein